MTDDDVVVLVPAGEPILAAAAWVGTACWAELRFHQMISDVLGTGVVAPLGSTGVDDGQPSASALWVVRAHRAEMAEAWHRRLPELREFPRPGFVVPGTDGERLVANDDVSVTLQALLGHYRDRRAEPMGSADGPVADTLTTVIARTEADLALLAARA